MTSNVQEVSPELVNDEMQELSKADAWLSEATGKAERIAAQYKPHEIQSGDDYKLSKVARTQARGEIAQLEAERKSLTRGIEDAVRDFKARAKVALQPLSTIDGDYKAYLDAWDADRLEEKREAVMGAYEELAPGMVPMLSPERLWDTYAKPRKWALKSTNVEKAKADMAEVVQGISRDYDALSAVECADEAERDRLRADYFETLDVGEAMQRHNEREARARAVAEHEREQREAREAYEREQAAQAEPYVPSEGMPTDDEEAAGGRDTPDMEKSSGMERPTPQDGPQTPTVASGTFAFTGSGPLEELPGLVEYCKAHGIHGSAKRFYEVKE